MLRVAVCQRADLHAHIRYAHMGEELVNLALCIINVVIPNLPKSAFYFASRDFLSSSASFSAYVQECLLPPCCNLSLLTQNLASKFSLLFGFICTTNFQLKYKFFCSSHKFLFLDKTNITFPEQFSACFYMGTPSSVTS